MGSRLQLHWRILHKGCTKSTAVASFGSSVYPSPLPSSLFAVPPSRTFPPMWQLLPYILLLCPEVKFVILFTYVRIHTLCTSEDLWSVLCKPRDIFVRNMISAKSAPSNLCRWRWLTRREISPLISSTGVSRFQHVRLRGSITNSANANRRCDACGVTIREIRNLSLSFSFSLISHLHGHYAMKL